MDFDSTSRIVHVKCRPSNVVHYVHFSLLENASAQLAERIHTTRHFDDPSERNWLTLDVSGDGFGILAGWLYSRRVQWDADNTTYEEDIIVLCEAYEAGVVFGIAPAFQDNVLDRIVEIMIGYDSVPEVILDKTLKTFKEGTPGRQFIFDWVIRGQWCAEMMADECLSHLDAESCVEFVRQFARWKLDPDKELPWEKHCAYHVHKEASKCYRK